MYGIFAMRHTLADSGSITTEQLPTFYLDENVQGIVDSDHAERIALSILGKTERIRHDVVAVKVDH